MSLIRRILNLQRRKKLDAEIQAELQSHIEMAVEDGIRRGMSEQEARREAILRFGNTGMVHESVADEDMFLSLNSICSDVLYAFRQLRRAPCVLPAGCSNACHRNWSEHSSFFAGAGILASSVAVSRREPTGGGLGTVAGARH